MKEISMGHPAASQHILDGNVPVYTARNIVPILQVKSNNVFETAESETSLVFPAVFFSKQHKIWEI
jgi:hypothetical protein